MLKEMKYPNNIAMVRRVRNLSQAYIAEQIGVSRPKYIAVEQGKSELTISQMAKLLQLLDCEFDDLMAVETGRFDFRKFIKENPAAQLDN